MTLDDWMAAGYKRWETERKELHKLADFGLQKLFRDEIGKRYYITVYVYDRTRYPGYPWNEVEPEPCGFMPTAHFDVGRPFFNVEMNAVSSLTVAEIEDWFHRIWECFGKPYYDKDAE